ncbi:uracil-DNA glycosylase, family 4 [Micromonospora matsumotoense]|uniref:Type-5 uracil-DNA glycosylase n=1 Tax=Micromonospora matsumotoense TaxID=121616 RepID=A0A1C4ZL74_9ACTN|nr:uracil-DNA glycosylase [Micromonospora matsumotoense]SCF33810.1 uracil-DNA glycosylase, family 4 [Micromonospora matsumotoense]
MVARAARATDLADLDAAIGDCFACPRLVDWREEVARTKRAAFRDQEYWGRPVPGFGAPDNRTGRGGAGPPITATTLASGPTPAATAGGPAATGVVVREPVPVTEARIGILGLAPAAHGGNRTGRVFTGDRSGDVLFAALHRAGLANQPISVAADDGLALAHTRIFAAVRCAPPDNKPTPAERDTCAPWVHREVALIRPTLRVVVALGAFAWAAWWPVLRQVYGVRPPSPRPVFGHGAHWSGSAAPDLLGCYHVSQQNTFTGRLTTQMLDDVFARAKQLAGVD